MSKKRKNPRVKPWENNEPFIEFVKLYQKQKFLQMMFNSVTKDRQICWLIEMFVNDRRYLKVLMPYLTAMFEKAKLQENFKERREDIWEVWFFMQEIAPFINNVFPEEGQKLLHAISDEIIPQMWCEFRGQNR